MGKFTPEELARMAPGRSPEELANLDMDDGEWERKGAELRAAHAQTTHEIEMIKAEGLHALNSVRFDPDLLEQARALHNANPAGPSVDELIEIHVVPIRERYLAEFDSPAPRAPRRVGEHLAAFNKLIGGK